MTQTTFDSFWHFYIKATVRFLQYTITLHPSQPHLATKLCLGISWDCSGVRKNIRKTVWLHFFVLCTSSQFQAITLIWISANAVSSAALLHAIGNSPETRTDTWEREMHSTRSMEGSLGSLYLAVLTLFPISRALLQFRHALLFLSHLCNILCNFHNLLSE